MDSIDNLLIELQELKVQLDNLERAYLQSQANAVPITAKTDTAYAKTPQVDANTTGIAQNSEDITDTQMGLAETYEEMNDSIVTLEEALAEVYEMIVPEEGGN